MRSMLIEWNDRSRSHNPRKQGLWVAHSRADLLDTFWNKHTLMYGAKPLISIKFTETFQPEVADIKKG